MVGNVQHNSESHENVFDRDKLSNMATRPTMHKATIAPLTGTSTTPGLRAAIPTTTMLSRGFPMRGTPPNDTN